MHQAVIDAFILAEQHPPFSEARSNELDNLLVALRTEIRKYSALSECYMDYPYSLFIPYENSNKNELVIELTEYGHIAALFRHGNVPDDSYDYVLAILNDFNFLILEEEEIREVENAGYWIPLFNS